MMILYFYFSIQNFTTLNFLLIKSFSFCPELKILLEKERRLPQFNFLPFRLLLPNESLYFQFFLKNLLANVRLTKRPTKADLTSDQLGGLARNNNAFQQERLNLV